MTDRTTALAAHPLRPLVEAHGVALRPAGIKRSIGLCPFHTERTPSFMVYEHENKFYCFGCQASGTVVDWLMRTQHLTAGQALRQLGMAPGERTPQPPPRSKQREAQAEFERLVLRLEVTHTTMRHGEPLSGDAAHRYYSTLWDLHVFFSRPGFWTWEDWLHRIGVPVWDACIDGEYGLDLGSLINKARLRVWATDNGWPLWEWLGHECRVRLFDTQGEYTAQGLAKVREKGALEWTS